MEIRFSAKNSTLYARDAGPFNTRQHLVNHVDMILGSNDSEQKNEISMRVLWVITPESESRNLLKVSTLSEEELHKIRNLILRESLFASEWQQIFLIHRSHWGYVRPKDITSDEDVIKIINTCVDIWVGENGDMSNFTETTSAVVLLGSRDAVVIDRIVIQKHPTKREIEILPVAINSRRVISSHYPSDEAWKTFAERICKNRHVKDHLKDIQRGVCAVCGRKLGERFVIHHVDYDHKCEFCNSGLDWRVPGTRVQPDCDRCHMMNKLWFEECISRLKAVHSSCNRWIDQIH